MDQRILGVCSDLMISPDWVEDIYEEDVISADEKNFFKTKDVLGGKADPDEYLHPEDISLEDRQDYRIYHARHFMNSVFHLFVIANNSLANPDPNFRFNPGGALKRICIGSDFDGLIDPIDCCRNSTRLRDFREFLVASFEAWEDEFVANGGLRISNLVTPRELMNNIFYQNAFDFLRERYLPI
jgi:hypothetical protein